MAIIRSLPNYKEGVSPSVYRLLFSLLSDRVDAYINSKIEELNISNQSTRLCRHLNYDIDEIKDIFRSNNILGIPKTARMGLWENSMEKKLNEMMENKSNKKCKRIYPYFEREQRTKRKVLEDFCEDRDKKEEEFKRGDFNKKECLEFNKWIKDNEDRIFKLFKNNVTERDKQKKAYFISNKCTFSDPSRLFAEMDCSEKIDNVVPKIVLDGKPVNHSEEDNYKKKRNPENGTDEEEEGEEVTINIHRIHGKEFPSVNGTPVIESMEGSEPIFNFQNYEFSSPFLNSSSTFNLFKFKNGSHVDLVDTVSGTNRNIFSITIPQTPFTPVNITPKITTKKIPPYIYISLGILFILISFIWFFLNRKKHLDVLTKEKEKVKTENIVPSATYVRLDDLEGLSEEIKEKQKEKLKKKIHVKKKVKIIEDPYKIKLLERKKWLWKTIIEIHMLILEEQRKAEWEFNKGDFLNICIDEFSRQEKKSDINVITSDLIFGEEKDVETIYMMNKQSDMWYRWVERHEYMLEKWKEEEWFLRLKESWRDEEEEYMKRAYKELLISLRDDKYHMSQRQKIIWRKWIAKHPFRVREFVIDKWFNKLFEELEKEGIISDEAIRKFLSLHEEQYNEEQIEEFIKYKNKVLMVILWIKIYMSILEEYIKEEDIESEKLFIDTSFEELKKKKEIEEEVIEDLKKDIYGIDKMKELEKYKGEDWFKQMQQDWIRREYKFISSYNLGNDDEEEFYEFVKKPTMEIQKDLLKEQWRNIELKWIDEDNDTDWLEDDLLKKRKYIKSEDKMKHRIIREDDIYSEELKIYDEIGKRSIYFLNKKALKWKIIIEIHLEVLCDCKMEEWEKNKEDFLDICIEELVKKQNEDKKNKENYDYITNESDIYDVVENTKSFWNIWTNRHNYMLQKWNKENWFVQLKNEWEKEQNEYMRKTYKELLISLKGDKYNMSQRQKIIWRKWIAKHPYKIKEEIINKWLNHLLDEIDKNGIISDEAIKKFLSLEKDISDEELHKYRKKKLEVILWIKIYMSVLEEEKNKELEKKKESFLNTCIDEIKKEEHSEENERMITIVDEMKKGFLICDKGKNYKKWKNEEWYNNLKKEWIKEEDKYIDTTDFIEKDEIYKDYLLNNPLIEVEKGVLLKHWKDMYIKWIDEDNERDWLRIAIDKNNINTDEMNEDINRMIELNKLKDYSNELHDNKRIKWKTIIEIHMEVLNDCKNEEWEMNKGDFLEICLEEFGNMENKEYSNIINNMLMVGELEYKYLNMDVIDRQNNFWNKWIERHRYMLEKWKKEKWFIILKENWKNEENKYMKKAYLELLISLREDVKNPMLQRQKIIWRKWIAKNLYHIESNVIKKWFDKLLEEIERKGVIDLDECKNLMQMEENEEYLEVLKEHRKKKLICIIWIKIYMMIIEEHKKEEYLESKEIFLDTCVDELKRKENLEVDELYMDDMKKSILLNDQKEEIEKLKMKKWYKDLKKEWIIEEDRYFRSIMNEEDDEEYKNIIRKPLKDIEKKISKKHWDDIHLKWIDEDNERDWLKIARNENEQIKYLHINENVRKKKYVPFYIDDYGKKGRSNKYKIYRRKRKKCQNKLKENNAMNKHMDILEKRMEFLKICFDLLKKRTFNYINIWEKNNKFYDEANEIMKQLEEKIFERQKILWYNREEINKMSREKWENEEWFIILKNDWNEEKSCYLNEIQYEYNINNLIEEEKKYLYLKKEKIIWKEWLLKNFKNIEECDNEDWFNNLMETYKIDELCSIDMSEEIYNLGLENNLKKNVLKNIIWIDIFMEVLNVCEEEELEHKQKNTLESKMENHNKLFYEKKEDYINKKEMGNYINDIQTNEGNQMDIPKWFDEYQSDEMSVKQNSIQKDEKSFIKELEEGDGESDIRSDALQESYKIYNNKLIEQKINILRESYIRNQNDT
ncbi:surface-associated interspersed protein 8.1 (SURFIN 8.1) [Plasmodium sp. DRC-Itaito]|nr:surface-associated interspersed protein 8.1 (SURFIN 8.1) [Plasmodium sp. DRC-Itaito]